MCTSSAVVPAPVSVRPIATGMAKDRVKADRPDWRAHTGAQATAISSPATRYRDGRTSGSPRTSDPTATAASTRTSCMTPASNQAATALATTILHVGTGPLMSASPLDPWCSTRQTRDARMPRETGSSTIP